MSVSSASIGAGPVSRDWDNREFVEFISANMKVLVEFINKFGIKFHSCQPSFIIIQILFKFN